MKIKDAFTTGEGHGKLWFMSDLHYNHENVIRFNHRQFPGGVEEMNTYIEQELAEKVGPGDILFDMGDLFWKTPEDKMKQVIKLASPKAWYKVLGNHDKWDVYRKSYVGSMFTLVSDLLEISVNYEGKAYKIVMCHYPMMTWRDKQRGSFGVFGHTHGNLDSLNDKLPDLRVDVGFDGALAKKVGSFLISFEDILGHMKEKAGGTLDFMSYVQANCTEL